MRFKTWDGQEFDGKDLPIMVILSPGEREQIANMAPEATTYCQFPDEGFTEEEIREWLETAMS